MICRHCRNLLKHNFIDLGFAPPSNAYLSSQELSSPEIYYPLKVNICNKCWLLQTEQYSSSKELFNKDYAYFSSTSSSWVNHAFLYTKKIIERLSLNNNSNVLEIACNDGYLLKNFIELNIPCLGIEPTHSTANYAENLGIPVIKDFFNEKLVNLLIKNNNFFDLIIANNVYAHVPNINEFTKSMSRILKKGGTITIEFPHLYQLLVNSQFDTIYHEHYSYLSLYTVNKIFKKYKLKIYDVEELSTHGGSLRVYGCHQNESIIISDNVNKVLNQEYVYGLQSIAIYSTFQEKANIIKLKFIDFLVTQKKMNKKVAAFGAAAKGNTLINFSGIKSDLISYICDSAQAKQGKYTPGSHIPILSPSKLLTDTPDYLIILPWNLSSEIIEQNFHLKKHGVKFVTFIPDLLIQ